MTRTIFDRRDYVFVSRWSDCDPGDPWYVGHVSEVNYSSGTVLLAETLCRHWRHAMRITPTQGARVLALLPGMEREPLDYAAIAQVIQG